MQKYAKMTAITTVKEQLIRYSGTGHYFGDFWKL